MFLTISEKNIIEGDNSRVINFLIQTQWTYFDVRVQLRPRKETSCQSWLLFKTFPFRYIRKFSKMILFIFKIAEPGRWYQDFKQIKINEMNYRQSGANFHAVLVWPIFIHHLVTLYSLISGEFWLTFSSCSDDICIIYFLPEFRRREDFRFSIWYNASFITCNIKWNNSIKYKSSDW